MCGLGIRSFNPIKKCDHYSLFLPDPIQYAYYCTVSPYRSGPQNELWEPSTVPKRPEPVPDISLLHAAWWPTLL